MNSIPAKPGQMMSTRTNMQLKNKKNSTKTQTTTKKKDQTELTLLFISKLQKLCHFTLKNKITQDSLSQSNTLSLLPTACCLCLPCFSCNIYQASPWGNFRWFSAGIVQSIFWAMVLGRAWKGAEWHQEKEGGRAAPETSPSGRGGLWDQLRVSPNSSWREIRL